MLLEASLVGVAVFCKFTSVGGVLVSGVETVGVCGTIGGVVVATTLTAELADVTDVELVTTAGVVLAELSTIVVVAVTVLVDAIVVAVVVAVVVACALVEVAVDDAISGELVATSLLVVLAVEVATEDVDTLEIVVLVVLPDVFAVLVLCAVDVADCEFRICALDTLAVAQAPGSLTV